MTRMNQISDATTIPKLQMAGLVDSGMYKIANSVHGRMRYFKNDDCIGRCLELYGEWAGLELEFLKKFIKPGQHVVDIGANIGTHSLMFAKFVGPEGKVSSIEAHPQILEILATNIADNNANNIRIIGMGVGEVPGRMVIPRIDPESPVNVGAATLMEDDDEFGLYDETPNCFLTADIQSLDNIDLKQVDFLKLDVEGMELAALRGAKNTIARDEPIIYAECRLINDGLNLYAWAGANKYSIYFVSAPAFSSANINNYQYDIFKGAHETALLMVPNAKSSLVNDIAVPPGVNCRAIKSTDHLVSLLIDTPRHSELRQDERQEPLDFSLDEAKGSWRQRRRRFIKKLRRRIKRQFFGIVPPPKFAKN